MATTAAPRLPRMPPQSCPHLPGRQPHNSIGKGDGHILGQILRVGPAAAPAHRGCQRGGVVQLLAQQQGSRGGRVQLEVAIGGAQQEALVCAEREGGKQAGGVSMQQQTLAPAVVWPVQS